MADFQLSSLFSDQAILCRHKEIRVFGQAKDGLNITVSLLSASGELMATDTAPSRDGRFLAILPPQEAALRCTLRVTDGHTEALACDIAIGDVYLAAGQSNMELELQNADEGPQLIRKHENILVRYYNVPKYARDIPEADEANRRARWQEILPGEGRDMSAAAYFFAMKLQQELNVPIGIIDCYWGGTSISCWMREDTLMSLAEGQRYIKEYRQRVGRKSMARYLQEEQAFEAGMAAWNAKADEARRQQPGITIQELNALLGPFPWCPPPGPGSPFRPAGLSETMLSRVVPVSLTGVLYYQGEEDTWRTDCYETLLRAFIAQLRAQFRDPALPFLNVQLPMWIDAGAADSFTWPRLRQAQWLVMRETRNSDLAVLIDQGEYDNIHPTNKRVVGERLCLCALRTVYHLDAPQCPRALDKYTRDGSLFVRLSQPLRPPVQEKLLMEIAGEDGLYHEARVRQSEKLLELSHPEVARPVKARYAWTDYALVPYFGENGLPLAPFVLE